MTYSELLEELVRSRILKLVGRIDGDKQDTLCNHLELLSLQNEDPITLRIDSMGGELRPSLFIANCIRFSRAPVHGIVTGSAFSGAFIVLQACDERLAYPDVAILHHWGQVKINLDICSDPQKAIETHLSEVDKVSRLVAKRSRMSLRQTRELCEENRQVYATEALELGLVDKILKPPKKH